MNHSSELRGKPACRPAILMMVVSLVAGVHARTLHVAGEGNDANSGDQEAPLRTIQKAAEVARAGDTVLVRGGVYRGHVFLRYSGEPGKPIVFRSVPSEKPVVDGEGRGRIELQSEQGGRKPIGWITVEGFEVRNGWDGIKFYNAHHIVLKGNFVHDNANQGILGNGHHVRIEGNVIAHNGFKPDNEKSNLEHGIYATGTDFEILNNVIHSNRAYGIQVAGYPFKPDSHAGPEFASGRTKHPWTLGDDVKNRPIQVGRRASACNSDPDVDLDLRVLYHRAQT